MTIDLADFVKWLGTCPTKAGYVYHSIDHCPIAQYLRAAGLPVLFVTPTRAIMTNFSDEFLPFGMNLVVLHGPYTYGDAYKRGVALLKRQC